MTRMHTDKSWPEFDSMPNTVRGEVFEEPLGYESVKTPPLVLTTLDSHF
jgi:hypothetical protein